MHERPSCHFCRRIPNRSLLSTWNGSRRNWQGSHAARALVGVAIPFLCMKAPTKSNSLTVRTSVPTARSFAWGTTWMSFLSIGGNVLGKSESMLIACNRHGEVLAAEVEPQDGPFHCPECAEPVILKQGRVKIAHFAHYPGVDCAYASASEGESEEHRRAKQEIFQALLQAPGVRDVKLERSLRGVRPAVGFRINGEMVAIEVQLSRLSIGAIESRTRAYAARQTAVLWTPPMPGGVLDARYAPKDWERYLHTLYFGKVYYWLKGLT